MANKKITAMPNLNGGQVATDLLTAVDLSQPASLQNVKSSLGNIFTFIRQNQTDGLTRPANNSPTDNTLEIVNSAVAGAIDPTDTVFPALVLYHENADAANVWYQAWWNETAIYYQVHKALDNGFFRWTTYDKATDTIQITFTIEPDNFVIAGADGNAIFRFALAGYQDMRLVTAPGNPTASNLRLYADTATGLITVKNSAGSTVTIGGAGGSTTQVQRNNAGALGGISGFTSDGTNVTAGDGNLRATSPLITTGIDDSNGNQIIGLTATASAVNYLNITNAASGGIVLITAAGSDSDIELQLRAKGNDNVDISFGRWKIWQDGSEWVTTNNSNVIGWLNGSGNFTTRLNQQDNGTFLVRGFSNGPGCVQAGYRTVAVTAASTNLVETDQATLFTNEGASAGVNFNLPTAPALSPACLVYRFYVQDADGITVTANTGDTIRIAGSVSASAGNINSTTIGSFIEIVSINATEWVATSVIGSWTVT